MRQLTQSTVHENAPDQRIDKYLAERFSYQSRTQWQKEITDGNISINGKKIQSYNKKVRAGDVVLYEGDEHVEPEVNRDYSVIYEDDFLIAVNKPANLPVHPAGIFYENTLISFMQKDYGIKLYPLHRLDRETSGVILIGKDAEVSSRIQTNFHTVKKSYLAIVHGTVNQDFFSVGLPIGPARNSKIRKKREAYPEAGETAFTGFKKLFSFDKYTLIKAIPETGRQHQIRVHLNSASYPILGDKVYGKDEDSYLEFIRTGITEQLLSKLEFPRCALHSRSIYFHHPAYKKMMYIKSSLPDDLKKFIEQKEK